MQGGTLRPSGFHVRRHRHRVTARPAAACLVVACLGVAFLVVAFLLAATSTARAQNTTSRDLMAATEQRRNAAFLKILKSAGDACDRVVQTQFDAWVGESDDWEAKCNDGGHYAISIQADPNKQARVLNCRGLRAVSSLLVGPNETSPRCRMR
jgi:hypothetical protein